MPKGIQNKRYTGEFKQMVIETMHKEKYSVNENHARLVAWFSFFMINKILSSLG